MLHIVLLILKIIGIILAVILGILVLLICIILFTPIRYQINAQGDGEISHIKVSARITWLLRLLQIDVRYENQVLRYSVRAAWKKFGAKESREKNGETDEESNEITVKRIESNPEKNEEKSKTPERAEAETSEIRNDSKTQENQKTQNAQKGFTEAPEKMEEKCTEAQKNMEKEFTEGEKGTEEERSSAPKDSIFRKADRIFKKISDQVKDLSEKKDKVTDFVQDEAHKAAFLKIKDEAFRYLKKLKPKKFLAKVQYGFEDPCLTGQVLAGLSIVYPFLGEHVQITPDFEHQIFKGRVMMKGNIYAAHVAGVLIRLILCKEIRQSFKDVRAFKL